MNNLAKITKLLSRGEKIIVINEEAEPKFIIMNVDDYERIVDGGNINVKGLTEEELLAKINRDIAVWKSTQEGSEKGDFIQNIGELKDKDIEASDEAGDNTKREEEDKYYFEPVDEEE